MVNAKVSIKRGDNNQEAIIVNEQLAHDIPITVTRVLDGNSTTWFASTLKSGGTAPPPPNRPPEIHTATTLSGRVNQEIVLSAHITDDSNILEDVNWKKVSGPDVGTLPEIEEMGGMYKTKFTPTVAGVYVIEVEAFDTQNARSAQQITITVDVVIPNPSGDVLFDSHRDTKLHNSVVRTITKEGSITPNGLGIECRASGDPVIVVNDDGTFSLKCKSGHGRFYGYTRNYNATMELECAFWNQVSGQDLSLKMRSRHNESGASCDGGSPISANRFGGYGWAGDRDGWKAKREPTHNCHDQSSSGNMTKPVTKQYFKIEFTVKDENGKVRQIVKYNGTKITDKLDSSPKPFMVDKALYDAQSYFWVRQNIDSGTGEIRIKSLKIIKA